MDKHLYVKEGELEVRATKFLVSFRTYDEGPVRYEFDDVITIEVEEERLGQKQVRQLKYKSWFLDTKDWVYRPYQPSSNFTDNISSLFNKFLHHSGPYKGSLCKAVEDYMKGQPFPKHMKLEKNQEKDTISIDLCCL